MASVPNPLPRRVAEPAEESRRGRIVVEHHRPERDAVLYGSNGVARLVDEDVAVYAMPR